MHAAQFAVVGLGYVDVERLALVDVSAAICCHLQDSFLGDFPHRFIKLLQIVRNLCDVLSDELKKKTF